MSKVYFFIFITLLFDISAQTYLQNYEKGKLYLEKKEYKEARMIFKDLVLKSVPKHKSNIEFYTYYYWAIAAYHINYKHESVYALKYILRNFEDWHNVDDVYYLLGLLSLQQNRHVEAIKYLKTIEEKTLKKEALNVLQIYLDSLSYSSLSDLYTIYPNDTIIGKYFYNYLKRQNKISPESAVFKALQKLYKESNPEMSYYSNSNIHKNRYNVGILLPQKKSQQLDFKDISTSLIEFVLASKLAALELSQKNIHLDFYIFNLSNDSLSLADFMYTMKTIPCDIFLSPIHQTYFNPIYDLALELQIPFVMLSSVDSIMQKNPFIISLTPSTETELTKAATFMIDSLNLPIAYIIEDNTQESKIISKLYQKSIKKQGGKVQKVITFNRTSGIFSRNLSRLTLDKRSISDSLHLVHVFIITKSQNILRSALSLVSSAYLKQPILGQEHWLRSNQIFYDQLEDLDVYFMMDYFIDEDDGYWNFVENYIKTSKKMPNIYAKLGYIATHFLGEMLDFYGLSFYQNLHLQDTIKIKFLSDMNFKTHNHNQNIIISTFESGDLINIKNKKQALKMINTKR